MRLSIMKIIMAVLLVPLFSYGAVSVSVNGSSYTIPQTNERGWGTNVTTWIQAISANTLQPSGGLFTLTNDVDFGANYGIKSAYYKGRTSDPSTAGVLRLANTDYIGWRNAANNGNLLLAVNGSNRLTFDAIAVPTISSTDIFTNKTIDGDVNTVQDLGITSLKTVVGNASKFLSFDGAGAPVASKAVPTGVVVGDTDTQTLTNKTYTSANISLDIVSQNSQDVATAANINALSADKPTVRLTGATTTNLNGIDSTAGKNKVITVLNVSSANVTVAHQSASALAADRIITSTGAGVVVRPNSSIEFIYDATQSRWVFKGGTGSGGLDNSVTDDLTLTASDTLAIDLSKTFQSFRVQGNAGAVTMSTAPFGGSAPTFDGSIIVVVGNSDSNPVTFVHNDAAKGLYMNGDITLFKGDTAQFMWVNALDRFVRLSP